MALVQYLASNPQSVSSLHPKSCLSLREHQRVAASQSQLLGGDYNELLYNHIQL